MVKYIASLMLIFTAYSAEWEVLGKDVVQTGLAQEVRKIVSAVSLITMRPTYMPLITPKEANRLIEELKGHEESLTKLQKDFVQNKLDTSSIESLITRITSTRTLITPYTVPNSHEKTFVMVEPEDFATCITDDFVAVVKK